MIRKHKEEVKEQKGRMRDEMRKAITGRQHTDNIDNRQI